MYREKNQPFSFIFVLFFSGSALFLKVTTFAKLLNKPGYRKVFLNFFFKKI